MSAIPLGERVVMESKSLKLGSNLAFTSAEYFNSKGVMVAKVTHTKFLPVGLRGSTKPPKSTSKL